MSSNNVIDFYLVDNNLFNPSFTPQIYFAEKYPVMWTRKPDMHFYSWHNDWLIRRFEDMLSRSQAPQSLLQFLKFFPSKPLDYFFIVPPMKVSHFITELRVLINWILRDEISLNGQGDDTKKMLRKVNFHNYDYESMCEYSFLYPNYCLIALKSMASIALKNNQFILVNTTYW